jgi:transcriptional regulator with XRE-family HTH domain
MKDPARLAWEKEHREAVGRRLAMTRDAFRQKPRDWVRKYNLKSASLLSNWESGFCYPDIKFVMDVCHDYGLRMDWIYRGIDAPPEIAKLFPSGPAQA